MFNIARKNLLKNTASTQTSYGVTFTVNDDGSVTVNGAVTSTIETMTNARIELKNIAVKAGKYIFSSCPEGGTINNATYYATLFHSDGSGTIGFDVGKGVEFELTEDCELSFYLAVIYKGYTANNLTFYPMLRYADITDDTWEPYKEDDELIPSEFNVIIDGVSYPVKQFDVVENGVTTTVWKAVTEFYWIKDGIVQGDYPTEYNQISVLPSGATYTHTLTGLHLTGPQGETNAVFNGQTDEVSTGGNKYMEVVISDYYTVNGVLDKFEVGGTELKNELGTSAQFSTDTTFTVDVSGKDTVNIAVIITAWAWGNMAWLKIKSIRFYS